MKLLDLFCGAGGAAMGYSHVGFTEIVGVDINPQLRYPFRFVQGDALEYLEVHGGEFDAIHASPPCQAYSVMNNLPWNRERKYSLLIRLTLEVLETLGKPYVLENVMGARYGAKGLMKRGLEAHGLKAGWLCGAMFGHPYYRHRLFATNWFWLAPGHPKHRVRNAGASWESWKNRRKEDADLMSGHGAFVFSASEDERGIESWPGRREEAGHGLTVVPKGRFDRWRASGSPQAALMGKMATLGKWQNGAQAEGVGVGHAKGWRLAAEAMGIDWMKRSELTQAIPPIYTEYIGMALLQEIAYRRNRGEA